VCGVCTGAVDLTVSVAVNGVPQPDIIGKEAVATTQTFQVVAQGLLKLDRSMVTSGQSVMAAVELWGKAGASQNFVFSDANLFALRIG
jgi:hypothetical protein